MKEFQPTCFKFRKQHIFLKTRVTDSVIKKFFREKEQSKINKTIDLQQDSGYGPVAQRITRLTTDQEIPGSNPGWLVVFFIFLFK